VLTAIDCESGTVVLRVETEDESLRLKAASVDAVQFISYSPTARTSIGCGPIDPSSRVFATYVESDAAVQATGIDGRAIAIEVLPEGYDVP
jgi:hypothetical protein